MLRPRANATASARGTIYQLCSAVEACFDLQPGERLLIEELGDLTVIGDHQTEIKHYNDELTDGHPNFWNTVYNWCLGGTDVSRFRKLVLATTQPFGTRARLAEWNRIDVTKRLQLLDEIHQSAETSFSEKLKTKPKLEPSAVLKQQRELLAPGNSTKLKEVAAKVVIETSQPVMGELYLGLMNQWFRAVLPTALRQTALNSLIDYVCQPEKPGETRWEIDHNEFANEYATLLSRYVGQNREFPRAAFESSLTLVAGATPPPNDPFVRKILDINHHKRVPVAIREYHSAIETIDRDFREHTTNHSRLLNYRYTVIQRFEMEYENACLGSPLDEVAAKRFYNATMSSSPPDFVGYADSPDWFRNGLLHTLMNDESQNYQWRLVADE